MANATKTHKLGSALLPGNPTFDNVKGAFCETSGVDPMVFQDLGLDTAELGYQFFEPEVEPTLYLLRAMKPGVRKTIWTKPDRDTPKSAKPNADGKVEKVIIVHARALLQDASGKLLTWDVSSKGAYLALIRAVAGANQRIDTETRDALQHTLTGTIALWVHKNGELYVIKQALPSQRAEFVALLEAVRLEAAADGAVEPAPEPVAPVA